MEEAVERVAPLAAAAAGGGPFARRVYAVVRDARAAVREVTLAAREALFLISWARVVFSCVAALARLSR